MSPSERLLSSAMVCSPVERLGGYLSLRATGEKVTSECCQCGNVANANIQCQLGIGIGDIGNWQHWKHWRPSSIQQQFLGWNDEIEVAICGDTFRKLARIDKRR